MIGMKKYTVLDLFAGAGGFSLGFEMTHKYNIIGAIEMDKWAAETYSVNHANSKVLVGDIVNFSNDCLRNEFKEKIDIIIGGPPCQGYSIANRNAGDPKDPRNSLFEEFIRVGKIFDPQIMIMENVPNLLKAKTESKEYVIDIVRDELAKMGYYVYHTLLQATDFGIPQIRKRLFVLASKNELTLPFPNPTHTINTSGEELFKLEKCPTLWDAISDLPDIESTQGSEVMEYDKSPVNDYQVWLRENSSFVLNHKSMNHSKRMVKRFESMLWGDSTSDVAEHLKPIKRNGNGETSDKVYDQNNRRMHPDKPCHTIAASFYANFVHPFKNRNFTAREGARIQSFPDTFLFKGKPTVVSRKLLQREGRVEENFLCQYNQIGNAVPPLLAKAIAENLYKQIRDENGSSWRQFKPKRKPSRKVYGSKIEAVS